MQSRESSIRRDQLVAPAAELIDIDALIQRLEQGGHRRPEALALVKNYLDIRPTLSIDDAPMRRICEVMTSKGCITTDSCEGHGECLPRIFFIARDLDSLSDLAYVLRKVSAGKNFNWEITVQPKLNEDSRNPYPIDFILQPIARGNEQIDPLTDRDRLIFDIHYLGAAFLGSFT